MGRTARNPLTDPVSIAWIEHCRAEHNPPNTVARRESVLRSVGNAGVATREDVEAWWAGRRDLSPGTRSNDLAVLRSFYKWAKKWEHRDDDPTYRLDAPKVDKGLPRPIGRAETLKLLKELPDDLARAVALGAYAGLRVSEAAALDWSNVDVDARRIHVLGSKGNKSRSVAVDPVLIDRLLPDVGGNVVTAGGKPYSAGTLQRKANRAIKALGVDATFHQLRHRYGTMAYRETRDLIAVGKQMGHSSPVTTAVYADSSDDVAVAIAAAVVR